MMEKGEVRIKKNMSLSVCLAVRMIQAALVRFLKGNKVSNQHPSLNTQEAKAFTPQEPSKKSMPLLSVKL